MLLTLLVNDKNILPSLVVNQSVVFAPTVLRATVHVEPVLLANTNNFFPADVVPGSVTITPDRYDNTNIFFTASTGRILYAPRINNTNAFFPADAYQFWRLRPPLLSSTEQFFPFVVRRSPPAPQWTKVATASSENYAKTATSPTPDYSKTTTSPAPDYTPA